MFVRNKIALVTGGVSGIGLVIVRELLKNGIRGVTIADVNNEQGQIIRDKLNEEFGNAKVIFVKTNVSDRVEFEIAMKETIATFNNFDILVNNAGIFDDNLYEKEILINLNGVINGCILAMDSYISNFKTSSEGLIINIASILGLESLSMLPIYIATKHAVIGLSKSLSAKVHYEATKTRIVTICPGFTDTPLLESLENSFLNKRCYDASLTHFYNPSFIKQTVEDLAKAIVPIMNRGENGSFWVIDGDNVSSVHLPEIKELKKLQTIHNL